MPKKTPRPGGRSSDKLRWIAVLTIILPSVADFDTNAARKSAHFPKKLAALVLEMQF